MLRKSTSKNTLTIEMQMQMRGSNKPIQAHHTNSMTYRYKKLIGFLAPLRGSNALFLF